MRNTAKIGVVLLTLVGLFGCHQASLPSQAQHSQVTPYVHRDVASPTDRVSVPSAPSDAMTAQPQDTGPGTAKALAQRATTYAQSFAPTANDRQEKPKIAHSDWPDPDAMRLTPQAQIEPVKAVANNDLPKAQAVQATSPPANASMDLRTVHELVKNDPPTNVAHTSVAPAASDPISARIASRAKDFPADLSAQLDDQLARYLRDDSVPDMSNLAGLAPEDRDMLSAIMDALSNFRSQLRADNNMLFSKKIRPLVELSDRLRGQAELSVPTVALCTAVRAYGVYDPMEPARFIAGRSQEAIVYCEVENFLSQPNDKNLYETRLTENVVIYEEASGVAAWTAPKDTIFDQARRRRHDFFLGKRIMLPPTLTIGRYLLKVTVEDQQARHIAENTVPFEIVAQ